jgi:YHS domain-containing protein
MKNILILFFVILTGMVHAAENAPSAPAYPLSICVVSGDKLGQMGRPTVVNYKGTEVRFCCKDCVKDFEKDPEKYLKRLKEAQQKAPASSL